MQKVSLEYTYRNAPHLQYDRDCSAVCARAGRPHRRGEKARPARCFAGTVGSDYGKEGVLEDCRQGYSTLAYPTWATVDSDTQPSSFTLS